MTKPPHRTPAIKDQQSQSRKAPTRRRFLTVAASAAAAPLFIPASALGRDGNTAPSERITLGCIGVGGMGTGNMNSFLNEEDCRVVAVCDVDANHRRRARERVNERYENEDCKEYDDFRDLIARDDIDAIMLATPDHWHSLPAIAAAEAGKDIYGEKPISHTFAEGRAMADAVKKNNRIWQTGSWQRSQFNFRRGCELVRNGRIGKVRRVEVGLPHGHSSGRELDPGDPFFQPSDPPDHLDYDFWLGPAPEMPYIEGRVHGHWRWNLATGGGQLMDWIGHHCDIAHWGLDFDHTGPHEVEATGDFPPTDAVWNSATRYRITCQYPDDIEFIIASRDHEDIRMGTRWIGEDGWVYVDRGKFEASDKAWTKNDYDTGEIQLYKSPGHHRNFLDCVKSREQTLTPAETAHRSATPGHLGYIAMRLGRRIRWNPETETIQDDPEATDMLSKDMRKPWSL